jgi:hypothetical protein
MVKTDVSTGQYDELIELALARARAEGSNPNFPQLYLALRRDLPRARCMTTVNAINKYCLPREPGIAKQIEIVTYLVCGGIGFFFFAALVWLALAIHIGSPSDRLMLLVHLLEVAGIALLAKSLSKDGRRLPLPLLIGCVGGICSIATFMVSHFGSFVVKCVTEAVEILAAAVLLIWIIWREKSQRV